MKAHSDSPLDNITLGSAVAGGILFLLGAAVSLGGQVSYGFTLVVVAGLTLVFGTAVWAAVCFGLALFNLLYGFSTIAMFGYYFFPLEQRKALWEMYPPDNFRVSSNTDLMISLVLLFIGLYTTAGHLGAYPTRKMPLVVMSIVALAMSGVFLVMIPSGGFIG